MADLSKLTPKQLEGLSAIRARRREITREATEEQRSLLGIVNSAATRRSEKRHRFMLLAGGIVGVSAPILLQSPINVDLVTLKIASGLLLLTIVVGAVFDAIDEYRTTPVLLKASVGLERAAALAFAEDMKLISAQVGELDADAEEIEKKARADAQSAHAELRAAGQRFVDISILETVLFFGPFVLGVGLLLYAVGTAA